MGEKTIWFPWQVFEVSANYPLPSGVRNGDIGVVISQAPLSGMYVATIFTMGGFVYDFGIKVSEMREATPYSPPIREGINLEQDKSKPVKLNYEVNVSVTGTGTGQEIKTGDVVRMKSGGPTMTVKSTSGAFATVQWFNEKDFLQEGHIPVKGLKIA